MALGSLDRAAGVPRDKYHLRPEWDRFKDLTKAASTTHKRAASTILGKQYSQPWIYNDEEKPHAYFSPQKKASFKPGAGSTEPELFASFGTYKKNADVTTKGFSTFGDSADLRA